MNRVTVALLLLMLTRAPAPARACNIPVFRYALERWHNTQEEDRYQAVLFHRGPLDTEGEKAAALLRRAAEGGDALANLSLETADLAGTVEEPLRALWREQKDAALPWLVLRSPRKEGKRETLWAGPLRAGTASALLDSPARREAARRLLGGDSVVWLLLESGDRKRDDEVAGRLRARLRRLEKTVRLPDATADDSVKLLSSLPLRLAFSTLRVSRADPREKLLVAMLLHADGDLQDSSEPMVFPVFGRGRVLDALVGGGINPDGLQDAARFLSGACSCLVKRLNPGFDLLITADWNSVLEDREVVRPRPPAPAGKRVPIPSPGRRAEAPGAGAAPAPTPREGPNPRDLPPTRTPTLAAIVTLLAAALGVLAWRARTRTRRAEG